MGLLSVTGRRTAQLAIAGLLGALLAWTPSAYAVDWLPVVTPSDKVPKLRNVRVVVRPDGSQVVAWTGDQRAADTAHVAIRAPGSAEFVQVATYPNVIAFVLGTGADGSVAALWTSNPPEATAHRLLAARLAPDATTFDATLGVTSPTVMPPETIVAPVIDANGVITAAWTQPFDVQTGRNPVMTATYTPGATAWSASAPVGSPEAHASDLGLAIDAADAVTAAFNVQGIDRRGVQIATKPAGGEFSDPEEVSSPVLSATFPTVATNGDATVVTWSLGAKVQAVRRHAGGPFGPVEDVAETVVGGAVTSVAIDNTGRITIAWVDFGAMRGAWAASAQGGAPFGDPVLLSGEPALQKPLVAAGPNGAATVVWVGFDLRGPTYGLRAAARTGAGDFAPALDVDQPNVTIPVPAIAVDAHGDLTAAWVFSDGEDGLTQIRTSVLDVTAPTITSINLPTSAVPGTAVPMTASATDRWGAPLTWTWDFGDGSGASGSTSSHAYAAGRYTVHLTATDAAGNATTVTRPITVAAVSDATAPLLTRARLAPGRLPTGDGARLKVTSSEPAKLVGAVQRKRAGRWRSVGAKRWPVQAGRNKRLFYGKTAQQRLTTGRYRVLLTATDVAGNASAATRLRFRVDRG